MLLFSKLSEVLDISGAEIAKRCGMNQPVLNRYMNGENVLPVQILLTICNALRIPSRYFVSEDNEHLFPNREIATVPLDCWQPIIWDKQSVELTFGDGEGRIFWKDVAVAMKVTPQKPHDRFLLRTRFPVNDFLTTCNNLKISPFRFLVDKNCDATIQTNRVRKAASPNSSLSEGQSMDSESPAGENTDIHAGIAVLTKKFDAVNAAVADLTAKYEDLLKKHSTLLSRHNELERKYNGQFGCAHIDMAAEGKPDDK